MSSDGYDAREVQQWINEIEEVLDTSCDDLNIEQEEVISNIRTHYVAAQEKIMSEGLSEEASYELEVAYDLLENDYKIATHLNNQDIDI